MKFSFSVKVPMRERLKILWLGGMLVRIDYNGQHKTARMVIDAIHGRDVTGNIEKEKSK